MSARIRFLSAGPPRLLWLAFAAAALLSWMSAGRAHGAEYPNTEGFGVELDRSAGWYARCMEVEHLRPPEAAGQPDKAGGAACAALDQYYDALVKPAASRDEWARVEACALATNDHAVLMMLYANGFGVPRDLRIALRHACALGGAAAEVEGRVLHLAELMAAPGQGRKKAAFDLCEDITSGYMMGLCASIANRQEERQRARRLAQIASGWEEPQKRALDQVLEALGLFASQRAEWETDLSGTARGALAFEAKSAEMQRFMGDIERFEKGQLPGCTAKQSASVDARLNQAYQSLMRAAPEDPAEGFPCKSGLRTSQRAWLRYRDAWVALWRARYPKGNLQCLETHLAGRRTLQLQELAE